MSAIVEPIGAIMGAALVMWMMAIIPYALAFAAGAMIFVVTEELIPESQAMVILTWQLWDLWLAL